MLDWYGNSLSCARLSSSCLAATPTISCLQSLHNLCMCVGSCICISICVSLLIEHWHFANLVDTGSSLGIIGDIPRGHPRLALSLMYSPLYYAILCLLYTLSPLSFALSLHILLSAWAIYSANHARFTCVATAAYTQCSYELRCNWAYVIVKLLSMSGI